MRLCEEALRSAKNVGRSRMEWNERNGVPDKRRTDQMSGLEAHVGGAVGEMAFCELHNVAFDYYVGRDRADFDAVVGGVKFDVKWRVEHGKDLLVLPEHVTKDAQAYALVTGEFDDLVYRGAVTRDEVFLASNLTTLTKEPTHMVRQSLLRDTASVIDEVNRRVACGVG